MLISYTILYYNNVKAISSSINKNPVHSRPIRRQPRPSEAFPTHAIKSIFVVSEDLLITVTTSILSTFSKMKPDVWCENIIRFGAFVVLRFCIPMMHLEDVTSCFEFNESHFHLRRRLSSLGWSLKNSWRHVLIAGILHVNNFKIPLLENVVWSPRKNCPIGSNLQI